MLGGQPGRDTATGSGLWLGLKFPTMVGYLWAMMLRVSHLIFGSDSPLRLRSKLVCM